MRTLNEPLSDVAAGGLSGLIIGAILALIICVMMKRIGKRKRLYDERQNFVSLQGKAASWNVTLVVLLIAWAVAIIYDGISLSFFLITGVYILHNLSSIITTAYYNKKIRIRRDYKNATLNVAQCHEGLRKYDSRG
jgi:hypothetical protein